MVARQRRDEGWDARPPSRLGDSAAPHHGLPRPRGRPGLTLDEFALWLHLEDVYWTTKGRQSIDAVVITASLLGLSLLGLQFWIDAYEALLLLLGVGGTEFTGTESLVYLLPWQLLGIMLAVICLLSGRRFAGIVGLFVPLVAIVGVVGVVRDRRAPREPTVTK